MTKTIRRNAFTLPELIIAMVIILLVLGGVVATLKSGLDVFYSSEANGKVTTGVRFTVATFKREILPMVNGASSIEILKDMSGVPATINGSGDYYIYRSTDCTVKCRSAAGDVTLNGSEYISSLDFAVPKASADRLENYMLDMHVEGQAPDYKTAYVSLDVLMALVGKPEKATTSSVSGNYYTGGVLHFSAFNFTNLKIRDASEDYKVLADSQSVAKGDVMQVHYDIAVPAGKKDATKILWYARTELNTNVAADKDKSIGYHEAAKYASVSYSDTTAKDYWWPLLIKSNDKYYLAGELYKSIDVVTGNNFLEIPTSNDKFYVYTGQGGGAKDLTDMGDFDANGVLKDASKAQPMSEYCFLRAWVVPSYCDSDGTDTRYPSGYAQWSTRVNIRETGVAGQKFFNDWMLDVQAKNIGAETDDQKTNHWQNSTGETATASITTSKTVITGPGDSNLIQYAKVISPDYLNDARRYDMAVNNGKSYTSPANYTIIIDAQAGVSTAGIGLLLNGYRSNGRTSGYVFYYDPGANGYPIRLQNTSNIVDGYAARGVREIESPQQADTLSSSNNDNLLASNITDSSNQHSRRFYSNYYNPQYVPAALQNNIFNNWVESSSSTLQSKKGDDTNERVQMQARRRYMITILEYYTTDEDRPRLLVRMRLLKNLADVISATGKTEAQLRAADPFLDGPEFYYSEPAWYGVFVGQKPSYASSTKKYTFKAMRPGASSANVVRTIMNNDDSSQFYDSTSSYYAVQTPSTSAASTTTRYKDSYSVVGRILTSSRNTTSKTFNGGVYKGVALDTVNDLGSTSNLGPLGPNRSRWIGIALWGGQVSNQSSIELYNMTLAPGFDESELRSIMETNAKVFGIEEMIGSSQLANETYYSADSDTSAKWNNSLFGSSAKSAGEGNTSMSNEYKNRFTNASGTAQQCIMSLQHTGGDSCGCPMCRVYQIYQDATKRIKFW